MRIRAMTADEMAKVAEIDRTEEVTIAYRVVDGVLIADPVDRKVPPWSPDRVEYFRRRLAEELTLGGRAVGAFDGGRLAALAVLGHAPWGEGHDYVPLLFLHVSRQYRRRGLASALMEEVKRAAKECGAKSLYISATPSGSALGFYFSRGARLAPEVDPELYSLEPNDIHLLLNLEDQP